MNAPTRSTGADARLADPVFAQVHDRLRPQLAWETFALTGDLRAARSATREALVVAAHHWRTVRALPDAAAWIRPRAWARARHRHWLRLRRTAGPVEGRAGAVLAALDTLSASQRRALVLGHVAGVGPTQGAAVLGGTAEHYTTLLRQAESSYAESLRASDPEIADLGPGASLALLRPEAETVRVPRARVLFRHGTERRRAKLFATALSVAAVALVGGLFVTGGSNAPGLPHLPGQAVDDHPVTPAMLLSADDLAPLAPGATWQETSTGDNRGGSGLLSACQRARYADPRGLGTAVRQFSAPPAPGQPGRRTATQTVEVSASPGAAERAYRTTADWYAGCAAPGVRIERAWRVGGVGEQAGVVQLSGPRGRTTTVALARTGSLTVTALQDAAGSTPDQTPDQTADQMLQVLTTGLRGLCRADASGPCRFSPRITPTALPATGEEPGTLGAPDLPPLPQLGHPWAGSQPATARPDPAATVCTPADLVGAGAKQARSRTYLVPGAKVPTRFGITEAWGTFPGVPAARRFTGGILQAMQACPKKNLGAAVTQPVVHPTGGPPPGEEYALWRLDSQINAARQTIGFWTGVVRVGRTVAVVTFAPVPSADVDRATFEQLVQRTGDRLREIAPGRAG